MKVNGHSTRAFREAAASLDVKAAKAAWSQAFGAAKMAQDDWGVLATLHIARTAKPGIVPAKERYYSHRWLLDHGLPSMLPDALRPRAERVYPEKKLAVGIAAVFRSELLKPLKIEVERAMSDAVLEAYADRKQDEPAFIRARIDEAKRRTVKRLIG